MRRNPFLCQNRRGSLTKMSQKAFSSRQNPKNQKMRKAGKPRRNNLWLTNPPKRIPLAAWPLKSPQNFSFRYRQGEIVRFLLFPTIFLLFWNFDLDLSGEETQNKATFVRKSVLFMLENMKTSSLQLASGQAGKRASGQAGKRASGPLIVVF